MILFFCNPDLNLAAFAGADNVITRHVLNWLTMSFRSAAI